jgi:hypothetical protein
MTGFAELQDSSGNMYRSTCTAQRERETSANFDWRCGPAEPAGAGAPAAGGDGWQGREVEGAAFGRLRHEGGNHGNNPGLDGRDSGRDEPRPCGPGRFARRVDPRGLAEQGEVQQVEMIPLDKDHLSGFASCSTAQGRPWRLDCTATRTEGEGFDWTCNPVVNAAAIEDVENNIREVLGEQGTVLEVAMNRRDDDNMTASRASGTREARSSAPAAPATRQSEGSRTFDWECQPIRAFYPPTCC